MVSSLKYEAALVFKAGVRCLVKSLCPIPNVQYVFFHNILKKPYKPYNLLRI